LIQEDKFLPVLFPSGTIIAVTALCHFSSSPPPPHADFHRRLLGEKALVFIRRSMIYGRPSLISLDPPPFSPPPIHGEVVLEILGSPPDPCA